jgi:hypothetical protein
MSNVIDKRARNIGLGLAGLTTAALGIAWLRNRRSSPCKIVEESVYREFSYRIERCPTVDGEFFMPVIRVEVGQTLGDLEHARKWVQLMVDQKLRLALENTFVVET